MTQMRLRKNEEGVLERTTHPKVFSPLTDIMETKESFLIFSELPGVCEKDLNVTLDKNMLCIKGKVTSEPPKGKDMLFQEYDIGNFERTFSISNEINGNEIHASLVNGVLKITLPKAKEVQPRNINIKVN